VKLSFRHLTRATLVLFITGSSVWPASPATLRCRSDPAVVLSDGTILDLSADIDGMLWDIKSVEYTIHIPSKTKALLVVPTPNWPTTLEKITVLSDQAAGVYDTTTIARTKSSTSQVTAYLLVRPLINLLPSLAQASGTQGTPVRVKITAKSGLF
jgi:hypothetical protein